mmetsp:Transcript_8486/g.6030  ORF Transcript_8486/g.6030 Transcript_8486/m.6030 type:complete len:82 (-) Transcript_8486:388-633(-)
MKILWSIMTFVTALALLLGVTAYMAYGNLTADSILFNLERGSSLTKALQVLYLIVITGSLVVQFMPIAQVIESSQMYSRYN